MVRFTEMCNMKFKRNDTEATNHFFEGSKPVLDKSWCYPHKDSICPEYEYSELGMGMEGVAGIYP